MKTEILDIENAVDPAAERAAEILLAGGTVVIPTETVYGLAADARNPAAVRKIFAAKDRPPDNPLIVHIASMEMLGLCASNIPEEARRLAEAFWPGPLTIVLDKRPEIPDEVTAGLETVAVRFPAHPVARAVIERAGIPVAAPSANRSGRPSPTTARHCIDEMSGRVDAIVRSGDCAVGVESTVLSLAGPVPRLLRPGGITPEQLRGIIGHVELDRAVLGAADENEPVGSPGMKYTHYAPDAQITLLDCGREEFIRFVNRNAAPGTAALCFAGDVRDLDVKSIAYGTEGNSASQAHGLFDALRKLDECGAQTVFARMPQQDGIGLAVYNRLLRAAGYRIIKPESNEGERE